jgi:hypothetical protein
MPTKHKRYVIRINRRASHALVKWRDWALVARQHSDRLVR